jgi:hypothetical protein
MAAARSSSVYDGAAAAGCAVSASQLATTARTARPEVRD